MGNPWPDPSAQRCPAAGRRIRTEALRRKCQYDMEYLIALNDFCLQLNEFCLLLRREILRQAGLPPSSASAELAQRFAETLILCPTGEAARASIRRDLAGARSFLIAAEGVLRRIRAQIFQFAMDCPPYQTKFYLLACAVEEILKTQYLGVSTKPTAVYNATVALSPL